jgi:hypothetical protein
MEFGSETFASTIQKFPVVAYDIGFIQDYDFRLV